jgi:hypothetical protein
MDDDASTVPPSVTPIAAPFTFLFWPAGLLVREHANLARPRGGQVSCDRRRTDVRDRAWDGMPGRLARARVIGPVPACRCGNESGGGRQGASRVCVVWRGSTNELERAMHVRGVRQSRLPPCRVL